MPTVANYIVIQDSDTTLGETDTVQFDFDAPNLTVSTSNSNRPMLLLKLNPHADNARLEVVLNNQHLYGQTFSAGPIRSLNEVFSHGQLLPAGNTMFVANRLSGDFTVSDLCVMYKADI
ncbi:hypothetical protein [Variovorax rhizosphaerae]|uniref:Alginate biosynthesis protein AlgF n=1 Tax=Variovorax rhizosphaerae TaxID=1836200 RepID=A0ABU8WZ79_9BURK